MLGKLSKLFESQGKGRCWDPLSSSGNPVGSLQVQKYLKAIQREQAQSHVKVNQAKPLFIGKLRKIALYINEQLHTNISDVEKCVLLRDRAF